jgi:cytochrome c peroxidase
MRKKIVAIYSITLWLITATGVAQALTPIEQLGKFIFFDKNLSSNANQACAACHTPETGWTGPDSVINATGAVYEASIPGRFGNRKPPSSAYATASPILHCVIAENEALFTGGNFWDGRATGEKLGNPAADQAQSPFLHPLEQALDAPADVVSRVCGGSHADHFKQVWGGDVCDSDQVDTAFDKIARSIAAFEASPESNAFTSKYDYSLKGMVDLTKEEKKGLSLFKNEGKYANCHIVDPGPDGQPPLFTDFTYDNLGVPRNPENSFYTQATFNPLGDRWIDLGLGTFLESRLD